ncbi:tyrosine-protein phosphatase [Maricaulis sp.]|uniref:tyrosine-protein phosphatase n=1 Tax=Maricaulis sp. TaxID=1486257 RepID=UPI003A91676B
MTRITPLDGVHNFRHFHGYEAADGTRVRPGLYRSGHFSRSSEADRDLVRALGITVVADLRRPRERKLEPSAWPADHVLRVISSDADDDGEPPHLKFLRTGDHSLEAVRAYMQSAYRRIPRETGNQSVFREGFKALASGEADGGFLVHCAAGKDRTGIFCALVLGELGVSRDEIIEDYLLTNTAVDFDSLVPMVRQRLQENYGHVMPDEVMRAFLGVEADLLHTALTTIGDQDRYLRDVLGITDDERAALRERWLER